MSPANPTSPGRSSSLTPWLIWILGASFFTYTFFQRTNPSAMVEPLMREFDVNAAALGNLSAVYFYAYAAMQIPAGIIFDRWGTRWILALAALASAGGAVLFALAPSIDVAIVGRVLVGLSGGMSYLGALALAMIWFPRARYDLLVGLSMLLGIAGGVLGQAPFAALLQVVEWRDAMLGSAAVAFLLALLFWLSRSAKPPANAARSAQAPNTARPELLGSLKRAARRPQTWTLSFAGAFFVAPMFAFAGLWAVPYLMQVHGLERPAAAGAASLMLIGLGIGSFLSGWISNRVARRKTIFVTGIVFALAGWLVIVLVPDLPVPVHCVLYLLIGIAKGTAVLTYIAVQDHAGSATSAAGSAIVNTFYLGGGAIAQYVIGLLLDQGWAGELVAGVRIYPPAAYDGALLAMPISIGIALLISFTIRESNPERHSKGPMLR